MFFFPFKVRPGFLESHSFFIFTCFGCLVLQLTGSLQVGGGAGKPEATCWGRAGKSGLLDLDFEVFS